MATYTELRTAFGDTDFRNRIEVGMTDAAYQVIAEDDATPNHANRLKHAFRVLENTAVEAERMAKAILTKNKAFTIQQIIGATDASIETQIEALWNEFADHYATA